MTWQPPTPTGTAGADLLLLELAETVPNVGGTAGFGRRPDGDGQVLDHLDQAMIEFAGRMETVFVATADVSGECDCSLRSGPPGFVHVLDDRTIAYPVAGKAEIGENAQIGLLMMADDLTGLHVNGTAGVVADPALRGEHPDLPVAGTPERWVLVRVVEAFAVRAMAST